MPGLLPFQIEGANFLADRNRALLADEMRVGKAQPVSAKVFTPEGFKPIGTIAPGDSVFGADGQPVKVLAVFPQGVKPVYSVQFNDGSETRCCAEHLWNVNTPLRKWRGSPGFVLPLSTVAEKLFDAAGNARYQIPMTAPVQLSEKEFPIEPYALGALLGNGCLRHGTPSFSTQDLDTLARVVDGCPAGIKAHFAGGYDWRLPYGMPRNPLTSELRKLGLWGKGSDHKSVPPGYLLGSAPQRLALLQGLLDTDGTAGRRGVVVFSSNSEQLADAVAYLVMSLGGCARRSDDISVSGKRHFSVTVALPDGVPPFLVPRKQQRVRSVRKFKPCRSIKSVMPSGSEECVCLRVDSEDGLYLTDNFIVTHNTGQAIVASQLVGARSILVLCPAIARLNWVAEFRKFAGKDAGAIVKKTTPAHPEITVCSYDIVANKQVYPRIAKPYDVVILDEAHYLRTFDSNRTQASYGIANGARYAWALTGTPTPRDHSDLYPLMHHFGLVRCDYWSFVKQFCDTRHVGLETKITGSRNGAELESILRPIKLRRLLRDVAPQMPVARWTQVAVEPGPIPDGLISPDELQRAKREEKELHERLAEARDLLYELDPEASKNFRRLVGLRKLKPVADLIAEELDSGLDKIVVFGWHRDVLMSLHKMLERYDARLILGSTSDDYKESAKSDFKNLPTCRVVIANIVAAGTAIDLSTADDALFIEEDWLPGNNLQAAMRIISQFKTRPSRIRSAVVHDSVDASVQQTLFRRLKGISTIFANTIAPVAIMK